MKNQTNNTAPAVVHQHIVRPLRIREDVFGWFVSPEQETPAHDPGPDGICPQCTHPVGRHSIDNPIKTISLAVEDKEYRTRSYFFRAHKNCWDRATPHDQSMIESSVIDTHMDCLAVRPECRECGTRMDYGQAIPPAMVEMDHGQVTEGVWDGVAPLVDVWKCGGCGHSFSLPNDTALAPPPQRLASKNDVTGG